MRRKSFIQLITGPALAYIFFGLFAVIGCGHRTDQAMVHFEHGLHAGSAAVDVAVDQVIAKCEKEKLPTPEKRLACVEDVKMASEATEKAMKLAVDGLRIYWSARAKDDPAEMLKAVSLIKEALAMLPPKYFAGLRKMLD